VHLNSYMLVYVASWSRLDSKPMRADLISCQMTSMMQAMVTQWLQAPVSFVSCWNCKKTVKHNAHMHCLQPREVTLWIALHFSYCLCV